MHPSLEVLESRIAPAAVFTYTEADGDIVTIKTSAKINNADFANYIAANASFSGASTGVGDLVELNLHDPVFRNSSLTVTVEKGVGGNGRATIGQIDANVDLKNVIINGDLASIEVGDGNYATPGLSKLQVHNLGGGSYYDSSYISGGVKAVKIQGDLIGDLYIEDGSVNTINIVGSIGEDGDIGARKIGTLTVGGNMSGEIDAGIIKAVRIGGDILGTYEGTGVIDATSIKSVRVGGSIVGGDYGSGGIRADVLGTVIVGGDIRGGDGDYSGFIYADDELSKVIVLGSVIGGEGAVSGTINGEDEVGSIRIDGSVVAGTGIVSGTVGSFYAYVYTEGDSQYLDELYPDGNVDKIVIGGSVVGTDGGVNSGSIVADRIGSLRIGGDVIGGSSRASGSISGYSLGAAVIGGGLQGGAGDYSASINFDGIGSLRVVKSVTGKEGVGSASIAGWEGIGSIKIGGDLTGVASESGSIAAFNGPIDSIIIGGSLSNDLDEGAGYTGIYAAGSIGRVTIGGSVTGGEYGTLAIRGGYSHPGNSSVPSIGTVSVKGNVENVTIEAGVDFWGEEFNHSATIGSVNITGNFIRSVIAAGVDSADGIYGNGNDVAGFDSAAVSRIASVVIGGTAIGTAADATDPDALVNLDSYGIFAQHIVALKVNGAKQTLITGATNDLTAKLLSGTTDVTYVELPLTLPV